MSDSDSVLLLFSRVSTRLNNLVDSLIDADRTQLLKIKNLKQCINECRLDVRDYELAESRDQQLRYKLEATERLKNIEELVITLGDDNILGPVDIAHISALLMEVSDKLD